MSMAKSIMVDEKDNNSNVNEQSGTKREFGHCFTKDRFSDKVAGVRPTDEGNFSIMQN